MKAPPRNWRPPLKGPDEWREFVRILIRILVRDNPLMFTLEDLVNTPYEKDIVESIAMILRATPEQKKEAFRLVGEADIDLDADIRQKERSGEHE